MYRIWASRWCGRYAGRCRKRPKRSRLGKKCGCSGITPFRVCLVHWNIQISGYGEQQVTHRRTQTTHRSNTASAVTCMHKMAAEHPPDSFRLLDLPDELLQKCLPSDNQSSRTACKRLFRLDLLGNDLGSLRLCLEMDQTEDEPARRTTLVRIADAFPALHKLKVHTGQHLEVEAFSRLLTPPPMHASAWLINVTDVVLSQSENATSAYPNFIPDFLTQACPKLTHLRLQHVRIRHWDHQPQEQQQRQQQEQHQWQQQKAQQQGQWQQQHAQQQWQPVSAPHLQHLTLDQCSIDISRKQVQQQLEAIPSLKHLKLVTSNWIVVESFSPNVTDLTLTYAGECWELADCVLGFRFPKLEQFTSYNLVIRETGMGVLSECMPKLQQLDVECFDLPAAYVMSKQAFSIARVSMGGMFTWENLMSLSHALQSVRVFELYARGSEAWVDLEGCGLGSGLGLGALAADSDLQMASSVVGTVQKAGGLRCEGDGPDKAVFLINDGQPRHVQHVMHCLLPMFHTLHSLSLQGSIQVDSTLLSVVGSLPHCQELGLYDLQQVEDWEDMEPTSCSFDDNLWEGKMTSLLPNVKVFKFRCKQAGAGAVLMLCYTAKHPFTVCVNVHVWWGINDERLMTAIQMIASHNRVNVEYLES